MRSERVMRLEAAGSMLTRPNVLIAGLAVCISTCFQILLSVVPALAERAGPHGMAGVATASLSFGAVAGELAAPQLMSRFASRPLLVGGQVVAAIGSAALLLPPTGGVLAGSNAVRGIGMGVALVVSVRLLAEGIEPAARGRAIGQYGLALSLPSTFVPSLGVLLLARGRPDVTAAIAVVASVAGAVVAWRIPNTQPLRGAPNPWSGLTSQPRLLMVFTAFLCVSATFGALFTYAPVALPLAGLGSAATLLLAVGVSRTLSRWLAGPLGDRVAVGPMLIVAVGLVALGLFLLAARLGDVAILVAAVAYGTGYGAVQTATFLAMSRVASGTASVVSALWNSGIDLGSAVGGLMLGAGAASVGYVAAFWAAPIVAVASGVLFASATRRSPAAGQPV